MNKRILLGIILVTALHAFNELVLVIAMPVINAELDAAQWYGLMIASYVVAAVSAMTWAGKRIDDCGPWPILRMSLVCLFVGHGLAIVSWDVMSFVLARVLQGIGGGVCLTVAFALINLCFEVDDKPRVISYVDFAWVIPSLLAPTIGGWLVDFAHWRLVFVVQLVPLLLAVFLLGGTLGPLTKDAPVHSWSSIRQALQLALGVGLLVFALSSPMGWLWLLLIPALLIVIVALRQNMPEQWFMARDPLSIAILVTLFSFTAFYGLEAFFPLFITTSFDVGSLLSGLMLTAASVGWLVGSTIQSRKFSSFSQIKSLRIGFSVLLLGFLLVAGVIFGWYDHSLGYGSWFVCGLGMGVLANSSKTFSLRYTPKNRDGQTATAMSLASNMGIGLAVAIGGAFKNLFASHGDAVFMNMVAILIFSVSLIAVAWLACFCFKISASRLTGVEPEKNIA